MKRRAFIGTMLTLLVVFLLTPAFNFAAVEVDETASISPPLAPLSPPAMQWNKTYGGTLDDCAYSVQQTSDGGYIVVGQTQSFGVDGDWWIVKTDASGDILWTKTHGGNGYDVSHYVQQTTDGGYIVAGAVSTGVGATWPSTSFGLAKIDENGFTEWSKTYGAPDAYDFRDAYCAQQTSDGGYVLAGRTTIGGAGGYDFWLVKTDTAGNMQWNKTYGQSGDEVANFVRQTTDGGYILAGYTTSLGAGMDLFLVKTDENGTTMWQKVYGGSYTDVGESIMQTVDGGYIITGYTSSYGVGGYDLWLVKTDGSGNRQWHKTYGGAGGDGGYSLQLTPDGGYLLAGYTNSFGAGSHDFWLLKTDASGNEQWNNIYGGTSVECAFSVQLTTDGGCIVAGFTNSYGAGLQDFWLVKLASLTPPVDDLSIVEVEPIQVILDAEALVANKSTALRVTVESSFAARVWAEINVTYDFGRRWYLETGPFGNGTPIDPGTNRVYVPAGPVKPTAYPNPWPIQIQPPWLLWTTIGIDSDIRAVLDPSNEIPEADETNNEKTGSVKVVGSRRLKILVIPLYFPGQERFDNIPSLQTEMEFLLGTYPVANDKFSWAVANPIQWSSTPPLIGRRAWLKSFVAPALSIAAKLYDYDRVVAVMSEIGFPGESWLSWEGYAVGGPWNVAFVFKEWMLYDHWNLIAHEIGHTYFLQHPDAAGPDVYQCQRFGVAERDYESTAYTFMEVRDTPYRNPPSWIDKERYDSDPKQGHWVWKRWNLLDQLTFNPHPQATQEVFLLRGMIFRNGTAKADEDWHRLAERSPDLTSADSGNYSIVLLNGSSQEIYRVGFNASFSYFVNTNGTWVENTTDVYSFVFTIPYAVGTALIEIRNTTEHVLLSRVVSPNAPTVSITSPNPGEILAAGINYTMTWVASDNDGDSLTYSVAYSYDGGETWMPLTVDLAETSYLWDTTSLPRGENYLTKVIASDGVNTHEDVTDGPFALLLHDVAVTDVWTPKTAVGQGYNVETNVTVAYHGDFTETFNVTLYANETFVELQTIALSNGSSVTLTFIWSTAAFAKGTYTISVTAAPILAETFTGNNTLVGGWVIVTIPGDVDGDKDVDIFDIVRMASGYGTLPPDPKYNPNCDIDGDGDIDIFDIVTACSHYGESW